MNCTAINSGDWNSSNVWQGGNIPGTNDTITIDTGVTVNIDNSKMPYQQFGNLVQLGALGTSGSLTVNGTLNIKLVAVAGPTTCTGIAIYNNSQVIVTTSGSINISATGYDFGATVNAYGMSCSQNGTIINNGSITIAAHNVTGGIGYGIYLGDDNTRFVNNLNATVTINNTDFEKDGRGHCYGFYISQGNLQNNGTISSSNSSKGVIKTDSTGTVTNTGKIINSGAISNNGSIINQGIFSNVLPFANYKGNNINNQQNGTISILGQISTQINLQNIVPVSNNTIIYIHSTDTLTVNAQFTITSGYTLVCKGTIVNNNAITNAGTVVWHLGATYTPMLSNSQYLIQGGTFLIQGTAADITTDLSQIVNQPKLFSMSDNVNIMMATKLCLGNLALTIPSNFTFNIMEGATIETSQTVTNNGVLQIDGLFIFECSSQAVLPFKGSPIGQGSVALKGSISSGFDFSSIKWSNFFIKEGDNLTITQSGFNFTTSEQFEIQSGATLTIYSRVNIQSTVNNSGTIILLGADLRVTSTGSLVCNNGEINASNNSILVWNVAGNLNLQKPIIGLYEFYIHGNNSSQALSLITFADINTQFIISNPDNKAEVVYLQSLDINEGYRLNINSSLNLSQKLFNDDGILRINTLNSYKFSSVVNSGTICIFNTGTTVDIDNDLSSFFPIFTGCTDFQVSNNDHLYIGNDSISGVNLTINGNVTVVMGKTLNIGNPATGKSTVKVEGSLDNTKATIAVKNTQGVGLHFVGKNPAFNTGILDLSTGVNATLNGSAAALYLERTLLKNNTFSEAGTITNKTGNDSTIYCNQGTICGGTFSPNTKPIGSAFTGQSATYVSNCGDN